MPGLTATQSAEGELTGLARLHVKAYPPVCVLRVWLICRSRMR
jgi:hypothetical protein